MASRMVGWSWIAPECCRRPSEPQPQEQQQFGKTQPLDPPPRAARLGAASGVEGPGRAQRQRREHDRPLYDAHGKEQPLSWIEGRPPSL